MRKIIPLRIAMCMVVVLATGLVLTACTGQTVSGDGSTDTSLAGETGTQPSAGSSADTSPGNTSEGSGTEMSDTNANKVICTSARLPEQKYDAGSPEDFVFSEAYGEWAEQKREAVNASLNLQDGMDDYYQNVVSTFLKEADKTSMVCSPFNIYMALSVLAETTDGESLAQILSLLQVRDKEALRARVGAFWEANYADTPLIQSLLANSLWLADNMTFDDNTINRIAEDYHASVFRGPMGEDVTNEALRNWVNTETKDLLKSFADALELYPDTAAAIVSTLYYKAAWVDSFDKEDTSKQTFHGVKGDVETDMMHRSNRMQYFDKDGFTAVALPLTESGYMVFCLPDEGVALDAVIANPAVTALFRYPVGEEGTDIQVNLTLPVFKVSGQIDMTDALRTLGVTEVFEAGRADFSPLTKEQELFLSEAVHACMVETDEDGVTGAAYTALMLNKTALFQPEEEVDFCLDRPFCFAVTSEDNQILFAGTVCNID